MPTRLERISNRYLRPNQRWRCGRAIDGKQCLEGPNQNGQCPKISEPCQPTLGIRFKKRRITLWLLLVLLASIGILANQSSVLKLLSPGKLSASHGEVAGCTNCHGAPEHSFFQWIGKIFIEPGFDDNSRCLECHKIEQNAFNPHTTSLALLNQSKPEKITESAINWKLLGASKLTAPNKDSNGEVDCASCHKEHKGESASVRQFNPERCQLCHSNKFDDIENGHPSYQSYPYKRRTRIQFDHSSHLNSYFFKEDLIDIAPLGCKQCHDTDQSGEWMLSAGFEQSCSTCHLGEILGTGRATTKGIPVLVIPDLDLETLHQHGLNVGEWPQWADGEFSPMMRLLLQNGDPKIKHLLEDSDLELFDLSTVESEQLETITNLAWLIKELLFDVQTGGTERLKQQFRRTIQSPLNDVQVLGLISSLPRDTLVKNQEQWFPGLLDEIPAFRAGKINIFQPLSNSTPEPDQETDLEQTEQIDQSKLVGQKPRIKQAESCAPPESIAKSAAADTAKTDPSLSNSYYPAIETNPISTVNSASWNTSGEWSQSGSELRYRAVQHMDEFVKAWMDVSSAVDISYATGFTAHLPDNGVVYMCLECHTREPGDEINWRGLRPTNSRKNTGNFSHNIHYSLMTDDGCESCHILNPDEIASFGNMDKNTCGQCHQPGRAPAKCSICHDQLFANENQAHPEFVNYPHTRPTKIRFDHASHLQTYFDQEGLSDLAPTECTQCHRMDSSGKWMLFKNHKDNCDSCHTGENILPDLSDGKGFTVFGIPKIDIRTLEEHGFNVGQWPTNSDGGFSEMMHLFLPRDDIQLQQILKGGNLNLHDLAGSDKDVLENVAKLTWHVKDIYFDIKTRNLSALAHRASKTTGLDPTNRQLSILIGSLIEQNAITNTTTGFTNLDQEITDFRSGKVRRLLVEVNPDIGPIQSQTAATQAYVECIKNNLQHSDSLVDTTIAGSEFSVEKPIVEPVTPVRAQQGQAQVIPLDSEDITYESGEIQFDDMDKFDLEEIDQSELEEPVPEIIQEPESIREEDWAAGGGWYREGSTVRYRPGGHADAFIKTWLEISSSANEKISRRIYNSLNNKNSVGVCLKCHTSDQKQDQKNPVSGNGSVINWQGFRPTRSEHDFDRFSHVSHFSLMTDDGCASCHILDPEADYESGFEDTDPSEFNSNFFDMEKVTCVQCHQPGRAPSDCLTCHRYHIDSIPNPANQMSDQFSKQTQ